MNIDLGQYTSRAVFFSDGENGSYFQMYSIEKDDNPTGVTVEIAAATRKGPVTRTFTYNDLSYPTLKLALASYEMDQQ